MITIELALMMLAVGGSADLATSGHTTLSMTEIRELRRAGGQPSEILANGITNPGFESGALLPWETNNWTITAADSNTGSFSVEDIGNYWIKQCFSPIPVADISLITFWSKQPESTFQAIDYYYSPTDYDEFTVNPGVNWTFHDITSRLRTTGSLEMIRIWGYSGGGPMVDLTLIDDVTIETTVAVTPCIAVGFCGDGNLDPGEQCDDGVANSDTLPDACRSNCMLASCGDGVLDSREQCDDGNNIPDDGCTGCILDTCLVPAITPVELLRAVKSSDWLSVILTWTPDPAADSYNTWYVETKQQIPQAREGGGPGVASVSGCHPTLSSSCWHLSAVDIAAGPRLFYQIRGVCGATEAAE